MSSERAQRTGNASLARRVLLGVLAVALALATLASCLTEASLRHHDCTGENCAACHVLGAARALMRAAATPVQSSGCTIAFLLALSAVLVMRQVPRATVTPVTLGVKLQN